MTLHRHVASLVCAAGLALVSSSAPAEARVSLKDDEHITQSLVAAQVGVILSENCPSLEPKVVIATLRAWQLQSYALEQGFSQRQIDRFLKNRDQQARILELARTYLAEAGATDGDPESYCAIGRMEIETDTLAGELLKED